MNEFYNNKVRSYSNSQNGPVEIDRKILGNCEISVYDSLKHSTTSDERTLFVHCDDVIPRSFGILGYLWHDYDLSNLSVSATSSDRRKFIKSIYAVSKIDEKFCGGAWIERDNILHIIVREEFRRMGIGQQLLQTMERYAEKEILCLWDTVNEHRHRANSEFFKKNGYDTVLYENYHYAMATKKV